MLNKFKTDPKLMRVGGTIGGAVIGGLLTLLVVLLGEDQYLESELKESPEDPPGDE